MSERAPFLLGTLAGLALAGLGCDHHAFSPPARALPLETAATLPPGAVGLQIEGAGHGEGLGPSLSSGTARVRYGVEEGTDVSVDASVFHVDGVSAAGTSAFAGAGRLGFKQRLWPASARTGLALAATGGVGGGKSAGGEFVSPDVGAIVSWENPYVVPFLSARGTLSVPVAAVPVDTTAKGDSTRFVNTPILTWMGGGTFGVRIPLGSDADSTLHGALLGGVGLTVLADRVDSAPFVSAGGGAEVVF